MWAFVFVFIIFLYLPLSLSLHLSSAYKVMTCLDLTQSADVARGCDVARCEACDWCGLLYLSFLYLPLSLSLDLSSA